MREFDLGDILSITTGRLVSRKHIGGVYSILDYMTGDSLMTHQLPRASRECRPYLIEQHPDLADVEVPEDIDSEEKVAAWLDSLIPAYGSARSVVPVPEGAHAQIDPIEEACDFIGSEKVYVYHPNLSR